jgi:HlyD family secretion protein
MILTMIPLTDLSHFNRFPPHFIALGRLLMATAARATSPTSHLILSMSLALCARVALAAGAPATAAAAPAPTAPAPIVSTITVAPVALADEMTYPARSLATTQTTLTSTLDGVVTRVAKALGQRVRQDEVLVTIQNTDPAYQFVPAKIPCPVRGLVSQLHVTEGASVRKGDKLVTVVDPRSVRLVVEVAALDLTRLAPGLTGEFTTRGEGGLKVDARITGISPLVDPATGTATVELAPAASGDKAASLPIGIVGRLKFKVNQRQGLTVPEIALTYRGDATLVRVVEGGVARYREIKTKDTRGGQTEVASGLRPGDVVITRASAFVADGQAVTVQAPDVARK